MIDLTNPRIGNLAGFLACAGMMAFALYAQYVLGLEPCPLCVFSRIATMALGAVFLIAAIHGARSQIGKGFYLSVVALVAAVGVGISARHVWLQNLPKDQVPACGPDLGFMLETFPLSDVLSTVLAGSGECAEVSWRLFGLTMPAWTLIAFVALGVWGVWVNWPTRAASRSATSSP
ncbi:MAG: disulfide bond formation protein B [Gammaproteobacteria bacterium]|nr:disulfide bond formation protein B [Gammaproteobacteria bacterium]NND35625.1 disulfide bond formation protein B [Gammaproteobacteria bacterium]